MEVLTIISSKTFFCGKENILNSNRNAQRKIYIAFRNTISSSFDEPQEHTDTLKLTFIITSQRKIGKISL